LAGIKKAVLTEGIMDEYETSPTGSCIKAGGTILESSENFSRLNLARSRSLAKIHMENNTKTF
jgi:hypothetical protein